jgi:hypothetical protein
VASLPEADATEIFTRPFWRKMLNCLSLGLAKLTFVAIPDPHETVL